MHVMDIVLAVLVKKTVSINNIFYCNFYAGSLTLEHRGWAALKKPWFQEVAVHVYVNQLFDFYFGTTK